VHLLGNAEFDIKKEAAWAVSNATSGGTPDQIKYMVQNGCIPSLCELLTASDAKIVNVALEGLENILKVPPLNRIRSLTPFLNLIPILRIVSSLFISLSLSSCSFFLLFRFFFSECFLVFVVVSR